MRKLQDLDQEKLDMEAQFIALNVIVMILGMAAFSLGFVVAYIIFS